MSNYIVLVKQVPDVSQITDNAFDPETGTLIRTRLPSVINELDTQALAFASQMRQASSDREGKIIALTMGPPMAEEVLRYSLSRCADIVVLLTDKALGGADTVATANPLAFAVRKIVKEIIENDGDYYVICGMQSVDGDTAQVPPQIAEELSVPCIAYVTHASYKNNRFEFTCITSGGNQVVAVKQPPAVITVAKHESPLFATFARTRWANNVEVIHWKSEDIKATNIGIKGSKTNVVRVFPPEKGARKCKLVGDVKSLAELLVNSYKTGNGDATHANDAQAYRYVLPSKRASLIDRNFECTQKEQENYEILVKVTKELGITETGQIDDSAKEKIFAAINGRFRKKALEAMINSLQITESTYKGEVWVVAEHCDGIVHAATFELIGKARDLADSLETKVGVCLAGYRVSTMAKELISAGTDNIYIIEDKLLSVFDPTVYRKAVADAINTYWPQIVLYAATPQGRILAPMVSYSLGCGLTADCTGLDIRDSSRKGDVGLLFQTRPALGGNVMATIRTKNSRSQMATARPGVMKRLPLDDSRTGKIIKHKVELTEDDVSLEIINKDVGIGGMNFNTDVVVSGGKGMQSRDNYDRLTSTLCEGMGKRLDTRIERGASRVAVEQGFIERGHQIGQTGTSIGPKLYVALGISGAIQHMIGVANSKTIIAINNDPNAPILKQCDYYIIGNAEDIVPQLVQALEKT